jgi:sporulation-control protein spo0M
MHNYSTGVDDEVHDVTITSTSDTTYNVTVSNPAPYISTTGEVQVYVRTGDIAKSGWTHYIDFLKITAAP